MAEKNMSLENDQYNDQNMYEENIQREDKQMSEEISPENNNIIDNIQNLQIPKDEAVEETGIEKPVKKGEKTKKRIQEDLLSTFTPEGAEKYKLEIANKEKQKQEKQKQKEEEKKYKDIQTKKVEIDKITELIQNGKQLGIETPVLDDKLKQLQTEYENFIKKNGSIESPKQTNKLNMANEVVQGQQEPEYEEAEKPDLMPEIGGIYDEAYKKAQADILKSEGKLDAVNNEISKIQNRWKSVTDEMRKEDEEINKLDNKTFWESSNAWQKILMAIGSIYAVASGNAGQLISMFINNHMETQKLTERQKLARKEDVYRRVNVELNRVQSLTSSADRLQRIAEYKKQFASKILTLNEQRKKVIYDEMRKRNLAEKLASTDGIDVVTHKTLDVDTQEKGILFPDDKYRYADTKKSAEELRKEIPNFQAKMGDLEFLNNLAKKELAGGSLSIEQRALARSAQRRLLGNMRLELFGPGVMQKFEQDLGLKIIGNPARILTLSDLENKKLEFLIKAAKQNFKNSIRSKGIRLPESEDDIKIRQLMELGAKKRNLKLELLKKGSNAYKKLYNEAFQTMTRNNQWSDDSMGF